MKNLTSIGPFSKRSELSILYVELEVLKPAFIDPDTNDRRYGLKPVRVAQQIRPRFDSYFLHTFRLEPQTQNTATATVNTLPPNTPQKALSLNPRRLPVSRKTTSMRDNANLTPIFAWLTGTPPWEAMISLMMTSAMPGGIARRAPQRAVAVTRLSGKPHCVKVPPMIATQSRK
jgi:hypothetical protein